MPVLTVSLAGEKVWDRVMCIFFIMSFYHVIIDVRLVTVEGVLRWLMWPVLTARAVGCTVLYHQLRSPSGACSLTSITIIIIFIIVNIIITLIIVIIISVDEYDHGLWSVRQKYSWCYLFPAEGGGRTSPLAGGGPRTRRTPALREVVKAGDVSHEEAKEVNFWSCVFEMLRV